VVITYRGKPYAKMVPFQKNGYSSDVKSHTLFGIWKDYDKVQDIEEYMKVLHRVR
jgi:hypothetical protein